MGSQSTGVAFLFPGQGSQKVGGGKDFFEQIPEVQLIFQQAEKEIPGLLNVMFEGPGAVLGQTEWAQPALYLQGAVIARMLRNRDIEPAVCAGHSLGEFTALFAAGVLEFEEGLRLVRARGLCMAQNVPEGGMAAVMGMDARQIADLLPEGVVVANYNSPLQTIISGTLEGLEQAETILKDAGARRVTRLAVSGPFHSPLMRPAAEAFAQKLESVTLHKPECRFISSVSGEEVQEPEQIRQLLVEQICGPVQWTRVLEALKDVPEAVECGPGKVLQGLARRVPEAPRVLSVGTVETLRNLVLQTGEIEK